MTTITSHTATEHPERVRSIAPVLVSALVLLGLAVASAVALSSVLDLMSWAFAGR
ncbi:hypothetical protein ACTHAM_000966 [Cellulomonas soli]|uniref:hypothetical protein n=1 Tax=Cellulomonas soli TaxID=931535 RepID=UPI003F827115